MPLILPTNNNRANNSHQQDQGSDFKGQDVAITRRAIQELTDGYNIIDAGSLAGSAGHITNHALAGCCSVDDSDPEQGTDNHSHAPQPVSRIRTLPTLNARQHQREQNEDSNCACIDQNLYNSN